MLITDHGNKLPVPGRLHILHWTDYPMITNNRTLFRTLLNFEIIQIKQIIESWFILKILIFTAGFIRLSLHLKIWAWFKNVKPIINNKSLIHFKWQLLIEVILALYRYTGGGTQSCIYTTRLVSDGHATTKETIEWFFSHHYSAGQPYFSHYFGYCWAWV